MNEIQPKLGYYFISAGNGEKQEKKSKEKGKKDPFYWNTDDTNLLIATYKNSKHEFDDSKIKKSLAWSNVAEIMQVSECDVTSLQCQNRWTYLLNKYKEVKDHNDRSGNDRSDWEFFERMEEILAKHPEFRPLSLASSISGFKRLVPRDEVEESDSDGDVVEFLKKTVNLASKSDNVKKPEQKMVPRVTKSAKKQQVVLKNSINDRKKKRKERPRDQLIQMLETLRQDRAEQADRDYEQRERFMQAMKKE